MTSKSAVRAIFPCLYGLDGVLSWESSEDDRRLCFCTGINPMLSTVEFGLSTELAPVGACFFFLFVSFFLCPVAVVDVVGAVKVGVAVEVGEDMQTVSCNKSAIVKISLSSSVL